MRRAKKQKKRPRSGSFRDRPASEFLRAGLVFGVLVALLGALTVQLAVREVSLLVLIDRLGIAQREGHRIARIVGMIGREGEGLDFSRVRGRRQAIVKFIREEIEESVYIHHIEVRDRFGVRHLFVARDSVEPAPLPPAGRDLLPTWLQEGERVVNVPLGRSEGEVLVGLSPEPVLEDLLRLRRSLRIRVIIAAAAALALLIVGLVYVLHLIRKNRRLEQARQSAARASYVGLLASGLAHEIRNPLNAMNMNLQMLEEELQTVLGPEDAECRELMESNKSEIQRLEQLVHNFLTYARPAAPRFTTMDLNQVIDEVLRFLGGDFKQSGIRVETEFQHLLPHVDLDPTQFKQALMNLLVNARQVLQPGGCVTVRTRAGSRGDVVIEISDDGPGIPEEARDRIFEVFYSSRGGGTGLGLPIARQVIERHGGRIDLESTEGEGTTFRIHLPRKHAGASAEGARE